MSSYSVASKTISGLADKLKDFGQSRKTEQILAETTALTQEAIVDKITGAMGGVRPHSGKSRRVPQDTVTDLVDTGTYRASWQISFPEPGVGRVSTNLEYAAPLEYGTEDMPGFFVARDTARVMRREFIRKLVKHVRESMQ
jgi:hypothetical protein